MLPGRFVLQIPEASFVFQFLFVLHFRSFPYPPILTSLPIWNPITISSQLISMYFNRMGPDIIYEKVFRFSLQWNLGTLSRGKLLKIIKIRGAKEITLMLLSNPQNTKPFSSGQSLKRIGPSGPQPRPSPARPEKPGG